MDITSWRRQLALLAGPLPVDKLSWPKSPAKRLLAYLHGGEVLRFTLPKLMQLASVGWLFVSVMLWMAAWPGIFEAFERWGLVKAYFAHLLILATALLLARLTWLRARLLQVLPADDFISLRSLAVLCRWLADLGLVFVVGTGLAMLLSPIGTLINAALGGVSTELDGEMSSGTSAQMSLLFASAAVVLYFVFYAVANVIDVFLAIEFNTRAERLNREL